MYANCDGLIATIPSAGDGQRNRPRQSFGVERHANPVMPNDFDQITTLHVILHTDRNLSGWSTPGIRSTVSGFGFTPGMAAAVVRSSISR
jgi:hypothetical protein